MHIWVSMCLKNTRLCQEGQKNLCQTSCVKRWKPIRCVDLGSAEVNRPKSKGSLCTNSFFNRSCCYLCKSCLYVNYLITHISIHFENFSQCTAPSENIYISAYRYLFMLISTSSIYKHLCCAWMWCTCMYVYIYTWMCTYMYTWINISTFVVLICLYTA